MNIKFFNVVHIEPFKIYSNKARLQLKNVKSDNVFVASRLRCGVIINQLFENILSTRADVVVIHNVLNFNRYK